MRKDVQNSDCYANKDDNLLIEFLRQETRCGYHISHEMKAVWMVEMKILHLFINICEHHNLKYFAIGGTLLGAIRHKGFIPWDDDIDVAMPREDYDKFLKYAEHELQYPYFLQTPKTDADYVFSFAKIRKTDTSAIFSENLRRKAKLNQGIFIDIFPLDGLPRNKIVRTLHLIIAQRLMMFHRLMVCPLRNPYSNIIVTMFAKVFNYGFFRKALWYLREFQLRIFSWDGHLKRLCLIAMSNRLSYVRWSWNIKLFEKIKTVPFEYSEIHVPIGYEEILSSTYGDWHKFVKGKSMHCGIDFDVTQGYKQRLIERYGFKKSDFIGD